MPADDKVDTFFSVFLFLIIFIVGLEQDLSIFLPPAEPLPGSAG